MYLLLTGGAGFIGSNVIRHIIDRPEIEKLVNLDCLTYAGHLENLKGVDQHPKYVFEKIDLRDKPALLGVFNRHPVTHVLHLAAESHVDTSITGPGDFIQSPPMKSMAASTQPADLPKRRPTLRTPPIRRAKPPATCWCAPIIGLT